MKKLSISLINLLVAFFAVFFLISCDKNEDPGKKENQYFLSNEVKDSISKEEVLAYFIELAPPEAKIFIGGFIKHDVEIQKLVYKTTFKDQNIQASGLICLPKTPGNYPVLSFQNGTKTLHSEAPTVAYDDDVYKMIESIASMGFIVTIPDNIGFGESSNLPHPYLDAKSSTQCILDLLRAAKELETEENTVAKSTKDLFIFGYSLGGWATMKVQESIEKNYSSEFNLIASSCGAGPYSLTDMNKYILRLDTYPMPYFLAYLLNSYQILGSFNNKLTDFFQKPYADTIPKLFDGEHEGGSINAALTTQLSVLLTPEYRSEYETGSKFEKERTALAANSIVAWKTITPTKLFHGEMDDYIPFSISEKMYSDFRTKGVPETQIELVLIPDADHTTGVFDTGLKTIFWFLSLKK
jgi:pimeloyl-ACP methyl ester carboxylesterase